MKKRLMTIVSLAIVLCLSLNSMGCDIDLDNPPEIPREQADDIGDWSLEVVANGGEFGITDKADIQKLLSRDDVSMVLINFWATWCAPSTNKSIPSLERVFEEYKQEGLVLLLINLDVNKDIFYERMMELIEELGITAPVLWDYDSEVRKSLGVGAIPAYFLVDKEGKIRYEHTGFTSEEIDIPPLREAIEYLLKE